MRKRYQLLNVAVNVDIYEGFPPATDLFDVFKNAQNVPYVQSHRHLKLPSSGARQIKKKTSKKLSSCQS